MEEIIVNGYKLDDEQMLPVLNNDKYSLIIAGAGSGKSLTLVGKIKYLLENNIYKNNEICAISFTNESCKSLESSINKNCNTDIDVMTFHKLALNIIKSEKITYKICESDLLERICDEFFECYCFGNIYLKNIILKEFRIYFFQNNKKYYELIHSKEFINYKKTIITFINLFKSNGYEKSDFKEFFKNKKFKNTLLIIYSIYVLYETEKKSTNSFDFDDMMVGAKTLVNKNGCRFPYKFIIIDEFQDTSMCRFNLIRELVKSNNASLLVVGDDYQSIYRFSGCDLYLFLHFKDYYENAKIYKLNNTYRNSQELISVSGKFIMKNKEQIKKELTSSKRLDNPIIIVYYKNIDNVLESVINMIDSKEEILIISRNTFDIKKYTKNLKYVEEAGYLKFNKFKERNIKYLTIHSSKGLESDRVIFLNLEDSLYGMPSKQKDETVLSLVKKGDTFPYEEERRLFYVGLTRTKSYVYLLTPINNPSIFIKEIKKEKNVRCIYL